MLRFRSSFCVLSKCKMIYANNNEISSRVNFSFELCLEYVQQLPFAIRHYRKNMITCCPKGISNIFFRVVAHINTRNSFCIDYPVNNLHIFGFHSSSFFPFLLCSFFVWDACVQREPLKPILSFSIKCFSF